MFKVHGVGKENRSESLRSDVAGLKKQPWHAPQLESVSIADLTEFMGNPGTDGAGGGSTLS